MSHYSSASDDDSSSESSSSCSDAVSSTSSDSDSSVDEPTIYYKKGPAQVVYRHLPFYQESVIIQNKYNIDKSGDSTMHHAPERKSSFYPQVPKRLRYREVTDDWSSTWSNRNNLKIHSNHIYNECTTERNDLLYRAYSKSLGKYVTQIDKQQTDKSNDLNVKEDFVSQGYFATFAQDSIKDCIDYKEYMTINKKNWVSMVHRNRIEDNPMYYGNCIQVIRCPCIRCSEYINRSDGGSTDPLHFVLHPRGQHLSMSAITLDTNGNFHLFLGEDKTQNRSHCDVGGSIMEIACFQFNSHEITAIARISTHVSVISCYVQHHIDHDDANTIEIVMKERARFHPENYIPNASNESFKMIDIAERNVRSDLPLPFQSPRVFATLTMKGIESPLHIDGPKDIHLIQLSESAEFSVEHHSITHVDSISQIAFSDLHPKVLWSASRQNSRPISCQTKGFTKRSVLGYGHSLHTLDLRCDKGSYLWSPSNDEFVMKNVHSVTGIYQDKESSSPHNVYVSTSVGRGKVYLVDARMPAKSLCSWGLPSMCIYSDGRSPGGAYGCGSILTKPLGIKEPIILGSTKEPGSLGTQLFRKPKQYGNFGTKTIELIAHSGVGSVGNFALSSYFPIQDNSKGLFQNGLAAFTYGSDSARKNICVLTSLSSGDLVSQILSPEQDNYQFQESDYISQHISQDICLPNEKLKLVDPTEFIRTSTNATETGNQFFENKIEPLVPSFALGDTTSDFEGFKQYCITDCVPSERQKRITKVIKRDENQQATPSENMLCIANKLRSSMINSG